MAEGGYPEDFCKTARDHLPECQYFAGGGEVQDLPAGFTIEESAPQSGGADLPQGFELEEEKFGSLPQQALTVVEGIGEGIAGPVFTALERASGLTTPEAMRGRRETNPTAHSAGEVAGFVGSAFIPGGQAALLAKAGAKTSKVIAGASAAAKIGRAALQGATEMALMQSGDEISKMIMEDPETSYQSAIANVGLAAALGAGGGAALGSVNPLWEATGGPKLTKFAEDFGNRIKFHLDGGVPAAPAGPPVLGKAFEVVTPEKLSKGAAMADAFVEKGLSKMGGDKMGKALGKTLGATMGASVGFGSGGYWGGALGALVGEKTLAPFFESILPTLAKPLSSGVADGAALKSVIDYGMAVIRGEKLLNTAMKDVFKTGAESTVAQLMPTERDREKLIDQLEQIETDPEPFLMKEDRYAHYLPSHGGAKGSTLGAAFEYLTSISPKSKKLNPLDEIREPTKAQKAEYENALNLAQQPALIFPKVKNGTVTGRDIEQMKAIYPALYRMAVGRLTAEMVAHLAKGESIPYSTRIGLSKFLGESLDSTMIPQSIMAAQQATSAAQSQPPQGPAPAPGNLGALKKSPELMATRMQSSEERHKAQF